MAYGSSFVGKLWSSEAVDNSHILENMGEPFTKQAPVQVRMI